MGCHDKDQPSLGSQAQVQMNSARILDAAVYTTSMPKNTDLSVEERQMLGNWLACGAP